MGTTQMTLEAMIAGNLFIMKVGVGMFIFWVVLRTAVNCWQRLRY